MAVKDFLKAISASLLMEQVMGPKWNFKTKSDEEPETSDTPDNDNDKADDDSHAIEVRDLLPLNDKIKAIVIGLLVQ